MKLQIIVLSLYKTAFLQRLGLNMAALAAAIVKVSEAAKATVDHTSFGFLRVIYLPKVIRKWQKTSPSW